MRELVIHPNRIKISPITQSDIEGDEVEPMAIRSMQLYRQDGGVLEDVYLQFWRSQTHLHVFRAGPKKGIRAYKADLRQFMPKERAKTSSRRFIASATASTCGGMGDEKLQVVRTKSMIHTGDMRTAMLEIAAELDDLAVMAHDIQHSGGRGAERFCLTVSEARPWLDRDAVIPVPTAQNGDVWIGLHCYAPGVVVYSTDGDRYVHALPVDVGPEYELGQIGHPVNPGPNQFGIITSSAVLLMVDDQPKLQLHRWLMFEIDHMVECLTGPKLFSFEQHSVRMAFAYSEVVQAAQRLIRDLLED